MFPDLAECVTSDDPLNVKCVLAGKFADWVVPGVRVRGFLPVLGTREFLYFFLTHFPFFFGCLCVVAFCCVCVECCMWTYIEYVSM